MSGFSPPVDPRIIDHGRSEVRDPRAAHDRQPGAGRLPIGDRSIRVGAAVGGAIALLFAIASFAAQAPVSNAASPGAGGIAQVGSAERGRALFGVHCSICHSAEGIPAAFGSIGPDLTDLQSRPLIAGVVPNTPGNLARWLAYPQLVKADTAMPRLGLSAAQADDLAAFLVSQQGPTPENDIGAPPGDDPPPATD